ncbi:YdeI/OmpD-associated family protein [Sorangium sp. So ce1000]|uniref:YdeI/OmpD-associated family protein n=1 Tax=Sorangium sp. So ce1000 TaxID=3133325 RepID=UPI003F610E1D
MTTSSPLTRKLQIKPDHRLLILGAPDGFAAALDPLPEGVTVATAARGQFDVVHLFVRRARDLEEKAPKAIGAVRDGGVLWISYPKRSSGVETDLTRDVGWQVVEAAGWGGVAQVAIDATWSALRFKPEVAVKRKPGSAAAPKAKQVAAVTPPEDLAAALLGNQAARATWDALAPSHRKEYARWIEEAKTAGTRARRVDKSVEMMAAGVKDRNEKYRR